MPLKIHTFKHTDANAYIHTYTQKEAFMWMCANTLLRVYQTQFFIFTIDLI